MATDGHIKILKCKILNKRFRENLFVLNITLLIYVYNLTLKNINIFKPTFEEWNDCFLVNPSPNVLKLPQNIYYYAI